MKDKKNKFVSWLKIASLIAFIFPVAMCFDGVQDWELFPFVVHYLAFFGCLLLAYPWIVFNSNNDN